jgi:hypothetical protein
MRESIIHVVFDLDLLFYHLCATGFTCNYCSITRFQCDYRMHASEYFRFIVSRLSLVVHTYTPAALQQWRYTTYWLTRKCDGACTK